MRPPPLPQQIDALQRTLERVAGLSEAGGLPVVVFDLDGTLFDNRPRTLQILLDYADEVEPEFPDVAGCLRPLREEGIAYLLSATLRSVGLTHVDVVRDITHFWRERFFSDEYLQFDVPNPGAPEYVTACHESGATIVYISARDVPTMMLGTVASLRDHNFPIGTAGVELVLKQDATLPDEAFKRATLPTLDRVGEIVGVFDNEPANCNHAIQTFPDAEIALLETQKVPGAPDPLPGVQHATDFRIL